MVTSHSGLPVVVNKVSILATTVFRFPLCSRRSQNSLRLQQSPFNIYQLLILTFSSQEVSGSAVPSILQKMSTERSPPTYNRTDKFSESFQTLIDAFGVANYREVNPGRWPAF